MKKLIALVLVLVMVAAMAAGCNKAPAKTPLADNMETVANKIIEKNPVEFMGGTVPIDITDTSEEGLWMLSSNTGLENADSISDAATFGPMMGSIAYCMSAVRVKEGADVAAVAQTMKTNIDPRKWVCVEADDLQVVSYGDVVMLIMVASDNGMTSQSFVDAFAQVCGGTVTTY